MPTTRPPSTDTAEHPLPAADAPEGSVRQRVGQTAAGPTRGGGPRPPRHTRWFVALGFTLLAASAIGTGVVLNSQAHNGHSTERPPSGDVTSAYGDGFVDVEGRVIELSPLLPNGPNRVTEVLVHDNDDVKKDSVLLRLDATQARYTVQKAKANLKDAELQLEQAKAAIPHHESLVEAKQEAVEAAKEELRMARLQLKEAQRAYDADPPLITKEKLGIAEATVSETEKKVQAAQKEVDALKKRQKILDYAIPRAREEVAGRKTQLDQAEYALEQCELKAPVDGKILRLNVTEKQMFGGPQSTAPAIYFCPNKPRIVRAEISQEFANQVKVGQTAIVTDDATLTGEWRGKVKSLSDWFAPKRHQLFEPRQMNDVRTLEAIIEMDPVQAKELRIGQRVRVKLETK
ncbi:MAG TPA: biotin/lipoyl-binding protein [Gemmataceae bacterium]|nr:biotin/lipoyl-binding protein [Gemmataceae bacterium]